MTATARRKNTAPEKCVNWVLPAKVFEGKGYTVDALRHKRRTGQWIEGVHYTRAPDGIFRYDLDAINRWEAGEP